MRFTGELAAVGTALCWGGAANFFVVSGRRMGTLVLNRLRLTLALVLLASTLWIVKGSPWPSWTTAHQARLLALSGIFGFLAGDALYFRSLVILGAGRAALLMSLSPVFAALLAWAFLHEALGPRAILGIAITLGGLVSVLYGRAQARVPHPEGSAFVGVLCGAGAGLLSACGFILSKAALHDGLDALSGTVFRVGVSVPIAWLLAPLQGGVAKSFEVLRDGVAVRAMVGGAILGPFIGVTLSLLALQHTEAAVATSIFACFPLLAILIGARFHGDPLDARTLAGALVTVGGVALLFARR